MTVRDEEHGVLGKVVETIITGANDVWVIEGPVGQVLLPGRGEGHNLRSTSLALKPGTDELFIVTNDGDGGQGSNIFHTRGFAKALPLFSHR